MFRIVVIFAVASSLAISAFAQEAGSAAQAETNKQLKQEIEDLKARLATLESRLTGSEATRQAPPEAPPASSPTPAFAPPSEAANSASQSGILGIVRGIQWQGFANVGYRARDVNQAEAPRLGFEGGSEGNFAIGDMDLFLTSRISEKASYLAEIVIGEADAQSFDIELARSLLKYEFSDHFKLSFGRYHTATSYYNSVYHTGQWLQTGVERPLVVEFAQDGGLLPTQAIGVSITGAIPSGKTGLGYIFEYGKSDTIRPLINSSEGLVFDENNGNGITAGIHAKPEWLSGLDIGGSFYHDRLAPPSLSFGVNQSVWSAHVVYKTPKFEFLNEGFLIRHNINGSPLTFNTPAFYSLISKSFASKWRPYFRYDYANASRRTPIYGDLGLRHGPVAGVRYDFNGYAAMKLEYDRTYRRQLPTINGISTQLAFRF